jgi:putative methanogenesis marker protein 8
MEDEHIVEALGKTRIIIRNGKIVEIGEPMIRSCPLAKRFLKPVINFTKDEIRDNIEFRIKEFGMFTKDRKVILKEDFVPFGSSELISFGIRNSLIDSAVIVCDGAGTVITNNPWLVQGIGGRMSGLIKTSPIKEVIERIEREGGVVLDKEKATINQIAGVELAYKMGFKNVAVTVINADDAEIIRSKFKNTWIFATHLTGISKEEAERLTNVCDFITACASKWIREISSKKAIMQAGISIPVFIMSKRGRDLLLDKLKELNQQFIVKIGNLPYIKENQPYPLI